jgi:sec-independent protein translocase protein TatB
MLALVFNLSGSEMVFLLLLGLVILGPDKLPDAMRRAGKAYAEFKKVSAGFQTELKNALDEPMREMRETSDAIKQATSLDQFDPRSGTTTTPAVPTPSPSPPIDPGREGLNFGGPPTAPSPAMSAVEPTPKQDAFGIVPGSDVGPTP